MDVKVEGLTKVFGVLVAVNRVSFTLAGGHVWGFIGPNGAGKTTTLRMLATVEEPTEGDAWLDGHSVTRHADEVRRHIGFMPDYYGVYPNMLVGEYLDFFARAYGLRGEHRRRRLDDVVAFLEIGPLLGKYVEALSKGMKQRISLGRALMHDPAVLLLDEPAAGLDPQARHDLKELMRVLAGEGKTIFISSHILAELEEMVDHVVIIDRGSVVYAGALEERHEDGTRKTVLDVRIVGDLREAARCLLEDPNVRQVDALEPDALKVIVAGHKAEVGALIKRLVERGIVPYQVMAEGKVLERMFLEATGEGKGGDDA